MLRACAKIATKYTANENNLRWMCVCVCVVVASLYLITISVYTRTHTHTSTLRCNTRDVVKRARCNTLRARRPRYANDVSPNAAQLNACVCVRANRFLGAGRPTDRPAVRPCTARFIAQLVRRTAYGGRRRRWPECCHTRVCARYVQVRALSVHRYIIARRAHGDIRRSCG